MTANPDQTPKEMLAECERLIAKCRHELRGTTFQTECDDYSAEVRYLNARPAVLDVFDACYLMIEAKIDAGKMTAGDGVMLRRLLTALRQMAGEPATEKGGEA